MTGFIGVRRIRVPRADNIGGVGWGRGPEFGIQYKMVFIRDSIVKYHLNSINYGFFCLIRYSRIIR